MPVPQSKEQGFLSTQMVSNYNRRIHYRGDRDMFSIDSGLFRPECHAANIHLHKGLTQVEKAFMLWMLFSPPSPECNTLEFVKSLCRVSQESQLKWKMTHIKKL